MGDAGVKTLDPAPTASYAQGARRETAPGVRIEGAMAVGKFIYESASKVDIDDRALAHLQVVMIDKLRRREAFSFSWHDDRSIGNGQTTIWVHPQASLVFKFYGSRRPSLNPAWIEALSRAANSTTGLTLLPEPTEHHEED